MLFFCCVYIVYCYALYQERCPLRKLYIPCMFNTCIPHCYATLLRNKEVNCLYNMLCILVSSRNPYRRYTYTAGVTCYYTGLHYYRILRYTRTPFLLMCVHTIRKRILYHHNVMYHTPCAFIDPIMSRMLYCVEGGDNSTTRMLSVNTGIAFT